MIGSLVVVRGFLAENGLGLICGSLRDDFISGQDPVDLPSEEPKEGVTVSYDSIGCVIGVDDTVIPRVDPEKANAALGSVANASSTTFATLIIIAQLPGFHIHLNIADLDRTIWLKSILSMDTFSS